MTLQQQVQQHLQNTGISLRELSRRSGISHQAIGKILRGGTYKSDTAHALYSLISITPISTYKTLDATVEQLAAQCIDADLTHVRDTELECAKYRRVMALEAELDAWQLKCGKEHDKAEKLQWSLDKSEAFALVVTKDLQIMQASWKAACVRSEQLQKQLDHGQAQFKSLQAAYDQQVDDEREMLAQIDTLFVERENAETKHDQQNIRLRVYVWSPICAIVFLIVSGLVVWGGA